MAKRVPLGILGVVLGMVVGSIVNMALITLNVALHGPPEGVDFQDQEAMTAFVDGMPALGFLIVLLAHSGQAFLGSLVGTLIAGRRSYVVAGIIGLLTLAGCVYNLIALPSPMWFAALDVLLPLPAAWAGARLVLRKD